MLAICIESSHKRGMGHFFRMLNITEYLNHIQKKYIVLINNDKVSLSMLNERHIPYEVVDLFDYETNWEIEVIRRYNIDVWLNDRMGTDIRTSENIKSTGIKLCAIDDTGSGARLADVNFAAMVFKNTDKLDGHKVLIGSDYLILNSDISKYRRLRTYADRIVVTLGGSDTYGVTLQVVEYLKRMGCTATIIVGPSFMHIEQLEALVSDSNFTIKQNVPSLIEEFYNYDIAITGGGVTPFEACASGLPCMIIANEEHEIAIAEHLENKKCAVFVGYYKNLTFENFSEKISNLNIRELSKNGLFTISLNGLDNIINEVYT